MCFEWSWLWLVYHDLGLGLEGRVLGLGLCVLTLNFDACLSS